MRIGVHRDRSVNQGAYMDLAYVLCVYVMIGYLVIPLGLLTVRVKDVSDAFTFFSDPSPPTGLPRSAMI